MAVIKLKGFKNKIKFLFLAPGKVDQFMKEKNLNHLYDQAQKIDYFFRRHELKLSPVAYFGMFMLTMAATITFKVFYLEMNLAQQLLGMLSVISLCTLLPDRAVRVSPVELVQSETLASRS